MVNETEGKPGTPSVHITRDSKEKQNNLIAVIFKTVI